MNKVFSDNRSGIYSIKNAINGKIYVGSAVNLRKRRNIHLHQLRNGKHHSKKLQNSWDKHGEGSFLFSVLLFCEKIDLVKYEQIVIDFYDCCRLGYNNRPDAGSTIGFKHSDMTKEKASLRRGWKHTDEAKKKMSEANRLRIHTPETKMKIGEANRRRVVTEESKRKNADAHRGKIPSAETRIKMSISQKERYKCVT